LVNPTRDSFESGRGQYKSATFDVGLDLRFRRFSLAALGIELNGSAQIGELAGFLSEGISTTSVAAHVAPFLSLRIVPSLRTRILGGLRFDRLPSSRLRYTGAGGATEQLPGSNAWGAYFAVAVEWQPGLLVSIDDDSSSHPDLSGSLIDRSTIDVREPVSAPEMSRPEQQLPGPVPAKQGEPQTEPEPNPPAEETPSGDRS
jgi:hypothetical protein